MSKFFTILTKVGEAKLANATALGQTVQFEKLAVGDGNGVLPTPDQNQTALVNQVRRELLNSVEINPNNPNWIICEQIIPEDVGGWTIREVGIYDVDGDLIAVGNFPETYKPILEEGSGRTQTVRIVLQVSSSSSVELKIDPSIVLATRDYVDKKVKDHEEKSDPHIQYLKKETYDQDNQGRTADLFKLPIYPECLTPDNKLSLDLTGTILTIPEGQLLRLRGWFDVSTAEIDLADRQFQIDLAKTYHLRYDRANGFRLLDLADVGYNPDVLEDHDTLFDSTYDDVLLALIDVGLVRTYKNVAEIPRGLMGYMDTDSTYALSGTQTIMSLSFSNEYSRAIPIKYKAKFYISGSVYSYLYVKMYLNGDYVSSSERIHLGNTGGSQFITAESLSSNAILTRKQYVIDIKTTNENGSPYFNVKWNTASWTHIESKSYIKVEVA